MKGVGDLLKIHDDAIQGNIAGVAEELAAGVDIDCIEITARMTALNCVCTMPDANQEMIHFLVEHGAKISPYVFQDAVGTGSLVTIHFLLKSGARINESLLGITDILSHAASKRGEVGNETLIPVLTLLIENGADVYIVSKYSETKLHILSDYGRFDGVAFLLDHGSDAKALGWTDLIRAVVFGTYEEVETLLKEGVNLRDRDFWSRTPWLMSLLVGDLMKAQRLLSAGAQINEVGRCGTIPMMYAVEGNHIHILEWLLAIGVDINATDDFGRTALLTATELGRVLCVSFLLNAGADFTKSTSYGDRPITEVRDIEILKLLIDVGEDLSQINHDMHRILTGTILGGPRVTDEEYYKGKHRKFGKSNPQRMDMPFWNAMVQCGWQAYQARSVFSYTGEEPKPLWCYYRYGRTTTLLPDGRIVEIAGEHADSYDGDFCIYNDVTVFDGYGNFEIWGYPEHIFPRTDFHTATLIDDYIYIIGSLGYHEQRRPGETPVYRLDCRNYKMECMKTKGKMPGWISEHNARYAPDANSIYITGGKIGGEELVPNHSTFALNLQTLVWKRLS